METETKPITQSVTIWGAALAAAAVLVPVCAKLLGFEVSGEDTQAIIDGVSVIGATVGSLIAIWGRIRATKTIS